MLSAFVQDVISILQGCICYLVYEMITLVLIPLQGLSLESCVSSSIIDCPGAQFKLAYLDLV